MAITAKDVEELHTYAEGVMGRADHHAGKVKGIALALLGGIVWRGEPDSIRIRRFAGSPANMLWVTISSKTYVFAGCNKAAYSASATIAIPGGPMRVNSLTISSLGDTNG